MKGTGAMATKTRQEHLELVEKHKISCVMCGAHGTREVPHPQQMKGSAVECPVCKHHVDSTPSEGFDTWQVELATLRGAK